MNAPEQLPVQMLTRATVTAMRCQTPDCTCLNQELWLHCRFHPQAGLSVSVHPDSPIVTVTCRACRYTVAFIALADHAPGDPIPEK